VEDLETRVTQIATSLWGPYGNNGLSRTNQEHGRQIGELYEKTENLNTNLERRMGAIETKIEERIGGLYRLVATLMVTVVAGMIGTIIMLVVTRG
jgi:type II secretory pathway component PulF